MKQVPNWYIDAFNEDSRIYRMMVYLYYEPGTLHDLRLTSNDIADWDIVRELQDTGVPCAYLGASSAIVKVYNEDKKYLNDPEMQKYIKRGVKMVIHLDAPFNPGDPDTMYFGVQVFTGWIDNFEFSDDGNYVTLTAYDSLHYLRLQPSPWFRTTSSTTIKLYDFIKMYMDLCGCREIHGVSQEVPHWFVGYEIDKNINVNIRPIMDTTGTIGDVLTQIAQFGILAIYCDCDDVIQIQLLPRKRVEVYSFDANTQIFSSCSRTTGYEDYTQVLINVYDTCSKVDFSPAITVESYSSRDMLFKKGDNEYNDISLRDSIFPEVIRFTTNTRMAQPNDSDLEPAINKAGPPCWMGPMPMLGSYLYITSLEYTINRMAVNIWAAKAYTADMDVLSYDDGRTVGSTALYKDETEDRFFLMEKTLEIDTPVMTEKVYAEQCAFTYTKIIAQGELKIDASVRGQPALELLDLVGISNPQAVHDSEQMLITRLHYTYNGDLTCDIETLSYSAVMLMIYAFLSPGFYIPYDAGAMYITAGCKPANAGMVDGGGAYAIGEMVTLQLVPMTGWEIDHWENEYGNRIEGATNTLVVQVDGSATYKAIMKVSAAYMSFTMDVNMEHPYVYIPPLALNEKVEGAIDWGDGSTEEYKSWYDYNHAYQIAGTMEITITAPIHNLAAEVFAHSTQINTFTAGSDLQTMANGTFYNSSVRNVNLLPANVRFTSGATLYNASFRGVYNAFAVDGGALNVFNNSRINGAAINIKSLDLGMDIPKYINGVLVTSVQTNSDTFGSAQHVTFPDTGYINVVICNTANISYTFFDNNSVVETLVVNNVNTTRLDLNGQVKCAVINNSNIHSVVYNAVSTYMITNNLSTLTDVYLGTKTERFDVSGTGTTISNLYVPTVAENNIYTYGDVSIVNIINYEGDE